MRVFHGSDTTVDKPMIIKSKRALDFGNGFYVTTSEKQAGLWAEKVAYRNATDNKTVNVYDFDIDAADRSLTVIKFGNADENWLDFVCANRQNKYIGEYDIVTGPVADDTVYRVVVEYENGDINKSEALKRLKTETLCDQILFHTEESLKFLHFVGITEVNTNE